MVNKDFQNGFTAGFVAGSTNSGADIDVVEEINDDSTHEQVPSALSVKNYADAIKHELKNDIEEIRPSISINDIGIVTIVSAGGPFINANGIVTI